MGWFKDFANSFAASTAAGLTQGLVNNVKAQESGLGTMLSEGTQSDFDKYVASRQAAVKGEYDKYTQKFDAFEEQAKQFAGLVGSPSAQNLGTELDGMEVAARYMQGKSQAQINDTIKQLQALKKSGKDIRAERPDIFKRGADEEIRSYTAQDIARMQLGGGFSYTAKPYDLSKRRTGFARFLRDDMGLFGETFAKERQDVAERQARDITASLPGYDKYAGGTSRYDKAQAGFDFGDLRTESEILAAKTEKLTYDELVKDVDRNEKKFKDDTEKNRLDIIYKKGLITDQETTRAIAKQNREFDVAKQLLAGKDYIERAAAANAAAEKNPENADLQVAAQEANARLNSFELRSNFYKRISDDVDELVKQDKKFTSTQQEGDLPTVGAQKLTAYTKEEALEERRRLWRERSTAFYNSLNARDQMLVDLRVIQPFVGEGFANSMRVFANVTRAGRERIKDGNLEKEIIAGVSSVYGDMSKEEKANIINDMKAFAIEASLMDGPRKDTGKDKGTDTDEKKQPRQYPDPTTEYQSGRTISPIEQAQYEVNLLTDQIKTLRERQSARPSIGFDETSNFEQSRLSSEEFKRRERELEKKLIAADDKLTALMKSAGLTR